MKRTTSITIDLQRTRAGRWSLCLVLCLIACTPKTPTLAPTAATPTPAPPDTALVGATDTPASTPTYTPAPQATFVSPLHTSVPQTTFISPLEPLPTPTGHIKVPPPPPLSSAAAVLTPTLSAETAVLEQEMWQAVNDERSAAGLPPYRLDEELAVVARNQATDMVVRGYWGHVSPEGQTLRDRLADAGLDPVWAGENYYYGYYDAEDFVGLAVGWFMDDPPHRDNLLHDAYTRVGIGIVGGPPGAYTVVIDFASDP